MIELRVMQKGFEEKNHSHIDYELFLVLSGEAHVTNGKKTTRLKKDEMFFINSNVTHKIKISDDSITLSFLISYQETYKIIALPYILYDITPTSDNVEKLALLRRTLKKIVSLSTRGATLDNLKLQSLYNETMYILVANFSNWSPDQIDNITISKENRLQMISDYIINNYNQPLSLQGLSEQFDLSVPYLSKYIKREIGMGFVQYLNNIRLYHAVEALTQTTRPVTQIAYDSGFTNLTSFNRLFKDSYNCSPSEYRKNNFKHSGDKSGSQTHTAKILNEYLSENPFVLTENESEQTVRVNFAVPENPPVYHKNWNTMLTFGPSNMLLDSSVRNHVMILCKNLGFTNIRIWGLFNEENSIDRNSATKFNFTKLNHIIDFLYDNSLIPYIDLGFQAEEIYGGLEETIRYRETDMEFTELGQYRKLLSHFLKNAINRYGIEYVEKWHFEMWKDPRLSFDNEEVTFFTVFDLAYEVIKSILPNSKVGGCGLPVLGSVDEFKKSLDMWSRRKISPDFFTVRLYPYYYASDNRLELSQDEDYFIRFIGRIKDLIRSYGMADKPFYVNAWNVTRSSRNSINDSCHKAAYIVKNTLKCLDEIDGIAYYGTTDLMNEHFDTTSVLTGGPGLLTKDGIKKPAYYAYQFLNKLGGRILSRGENYIATQDHDNIIILCHNCVQPNLNYFLYYKDNVKPTQLESLFEGENLSLMFSISQLEKKEYIVKKHRLNRQSGSVLDIWLNTGMSESADTEDIQYYKSMCIPSLSSGTIESKYSRLSFKTELEPNEIQLIHFKPQS